ncbi:MAG: hypothetical protein ACWGPS_01715 [Candidatus Promineifilaceae bacterium]
MRDQVLLYISAAPDLRTERDLLGRAVAEMPVPLAWRVVQSPRSNQPVDPDAIAQADVHLLLMGGDIRAPIGLEWLIARRAGRLPVLFLKESVSRTLAALDFVRTVENQTPWGTFKEGRELRRQVEILLVNYLLDRVVTFSLTKVDVDLLSSWLAEREAGKVSDEQQGSGEAGDSGLILSTERFEPSDGILLGPAAQKNRERSDEPDLPESFDQSQ